MDMLPLHFALVSPPSGFSGFRSSN